MTKHCFSVILTVLLLSTLVNGFLHTSGRWIVNEQGKRVKLACVNWYGAEEKDFVVGGLQAQPRNKIAATIKSMGFNCVRLPWSVEMWNNNPVVSNKTVLAKNTDLVGRTARDIFADIVDSLTSIGVMVILDNHASDADWCCSKNDENGLWYNSRFPESAWVNAWKSIVTQFKTNKNVIGCDLRNEIREACDYNGGNCKSPNWAKGGTNDWHAAATMVAEEILKINSEVLIIVEGLNYALDLTGVYDHPISLSVPNRVVYEAHDYPWDFPSTLTYDSFKTKVGDNWGYIVTQNKPFTAPVWVGEFGTCHTSLSCVNNTKGNGLWWGYLMRYLHEADFEWGYWAIDGTQSSGKGRKFGHEESYGILNMDWSEAALPKLLEDLQAIQKCTQNCG